MTELEKELYALILRLSDTGIFDSLDEEDLTEKEWALLSRIDESRFQ